MHSTHPSLSEFHKYTRADWVKVAESQLQGKNPDKALSWGIPGLPHLQPYYDAADLIGLDEQLLFFQKLPAHRWKLYEEIHIQDEKEANHIALEALMGGCDGLLFHVSSSVDMNGVLKGIDTKICDISVLDGPSDTSNHMNPTNTQMALRPAKDPIDQILSIFEGIKGKKYVLRHAWEDFFLEMATLRALRYLLCALFDMPEVEIHTTVPTHPDPDYQWFLNTTSSMASILGGSHSISMPTQIGDLRTTRNIGNLIRDESKIETYTDPCGGSYYLEVLTSEIINRCKTSQK